MTSVSCDQVHLLSAHLLVAILANVVGPESAKRIGHAYRSVHDIDLFVGGIAERPVVGGLVGPTFACIIAQQFSNSRRGDRFWYENGGFESSFTPAQLHSLRRVSLAQVLCRTVGGGTLQPHIFIPAEFEDNERQTCGVGSLSPIDLSPWLEQDPFHNQQVPEQVFTIGQPELGSVQIIKEDKAGFSNRVKPIKPQVEVSPSSLNGFHRPTNENLTKVSDKLDLRRKTVTKKNNTNNRQQTTRKPVGGVNKKLDKSPKITLNIKSVNVRRPEGSGLKRRVIINNVPVELRSSGGNATAEETEPGNLTDEDDEFHDDADEVVDMEDVVEVRASKDDPSKLTKTDLNQNRNDSKTTETEQTEKNTTIEPTEDSTDEPKTERRDARKMEPHPAAKTPDKTADSRLLHNQRNRTTTPRDFQASSTVSLKRFTRQTKAPKISKPTKRAEELRQYQNRPLYERPQKVVVNGPNADQYEIEINIRQTNKNPASRPSTSDYAQYTTANKPYFNSNYAPHYMDYASTTPIPLPNYGYHQPIGEISNQGVRTKPPTIIYLNDNDDRRTTTRAPNIFQNFLTFATNSFNPLGIRRPMPTTPSPISQSHKEPGQFENNVVHSPISNSHILTGGGPSASYSPRPPSVHSYPVATSSQIGGNPGSGFLHASSSAVSAGHFGSISGVATANGADSTFSFNIRPRPSPDLGSVVSSFPRPVSSQGGGSSYRPDYAPTQSELYYDRELITDRNPSPFSGSSSAQRPHQQTFYGRSPELKEVGNNSNELTHTEHKLYLQDYDYASRTLSNLTTDESHQTDDDTDYVYDEDIASNDLDKTKTRKETDLNELTTKKFDQDGYMRPQLMRDATHNSTGYNVTSLDDNYVMPMLENRTRTNYVTEVPKPMLSTSSRSVTNSKVTVFPDSLGKQLANDILADEATDDYVDANGHTEARLKAQKLKQLASVAFAPITVLTKPDRPDNWVIYNKASEEPPLPQPPAVNMDVAPSGEVPTPIKNFNNAWLKQDLKARPETPPTRLAEEVTTVAAADSI